MKRDEMKVIEKSIVPIYEKNCIDGSGSNEQVVNARELWRVLESRQDFSTWVKKRLQDVDAEEGRDYCLLHEKMEQPSGAKHRIEYIVTMDTAKEMAMLERNDMGKTVRRYFIEAEKRYRELKIIRARSKAERRLFTDILKEVLPESPHKGRSPHHLFLAPAGYVWYTGTTQTRKNIEGGNGNEKDYRVSPYVGHGVLVVRVRYVRLQKSSGTV